MIIFSWCKSWNAEIEACDGLATTTVHALLGMKIPYIINKDFIKGWAYAAGKTTVGKQLQQQVTNQIVWEIEDDDED